MSAPGSMPERSEQETASTKPVVMLYRERFHLKYFFVGSKLPAVLVAVSIFFLWLLNRGLVRSLEPTITNTTPDPEHVEGGKITEILTALIQAVLDAIVRIFGAIFKMFPVFDLSWLPWLALLWWIFVVWSIARSWFRWYRSYAEVSAQGFTIYTPRSFWFALGNKGNRTVPAQMVYDADEASSIIDNTMFAKTVSRVNIFVRDTAGDDDSVSVDYARKGAELIHAIKYIAQFNSPMGQPDRM